MTKLGEIKLQGSINALKDHIRSLLWNIKVITDEPHMVHGQYVDMQRSIDQMEQLLKDTQQAFNAVQELDPRHK